MLSPLDADRVTRAKGNKHEEYNPTTGCFFEKAFRNIFSLSFNSYTNDKFKSGRVLRVEDT